MTDAINFDASLLKGAITKRSERKKANNEKIISAFKEAKTDKKLNKQEIKALKDMGLTEAQIHQLQKTDDGMQTLNDLAYSHLDAGENGNFAIKTGDGADAEIKQQRQAEVTEFVLEVQSYEEFEARLAQFEGVDFVDDDLKAQLEDAYQTEKLGRKKTTFTPDVIANPEAKEVQIRVQAEKAENGEIKKLNLYETTDEESKVNPDETKPTRTLVKDGKYFIEGEGDDVKYYSYNAEEGTLSDVTTKVKSDAAAAKLKSDIEALANFAPKEGDADFEAYNSANDTSKLVMLQGKQRAQQAATEKKEDIKTAFERENITKNGITIDETGAKQRLTTSQKWNTEVVVPKKATYDQNGYPSQLAIELPGDYGSKNADGVKQKRYYTLKYNPEKDVYEDKYQNRQFKVDIQDGKIILKQHEINDKKVKEFLDTNTHIAAEKAKTAALNDKQTKFKEEMSEEDVAALKAGLSNRNTAWETYLQAGTENGRLTGTLGVFEELFDEGHVKNYNDIKPMLDGLMARVPEDVRNTEEYKAVVAIIDDISADPTKQQNTKFFGNSDGVGAGAGAVVGGIVTGVATGAKLGATAGAIGAGAGAVVGGVVGAAVDGAAPSGGKVRELDVALLNLAKTHLAGRVQGTNHANNSFIVGGSGANKVTIQPDNASSMWMTDAKFTIGGQDYYLYETRDIMDRTIDFQDLVQHKDDGKRDKLTLLSNDVTGNNRHGEIKANAKRFDADTFYFKGTDGVKQNCVVENGVVYVCSPNGQVKVPLEDVLNGRKPMPQDPPAATTGVAGGGSTVTQTLSTGQMPTNKQEVIDTLATGALHKKVQKMASDIPIDAWPSTQPFK